MEDLWEHFSADGKPRVKRLKVTGDTDPETHSCPIQRVVFIDSTWNQTTRIITDERLQGAEDALDSLRVSLTRAESCIEFMKMKKGFVLLCGAD